MRIDVWLVEKGHAPSRQKAQELIASGRVGLANGSDLKPIKKPSFTVDSSNEERIQVATHDGPEFVSRGGQ